MSCWGACASALLLIQLQFPLLLVHPQMPVLSWELLSSNSYTKHQTWLTFLHTIPYSLFLVLLLAESPAVCLGHNCSTPHSLLL